MDHPPLFKWRHFTGELILCAVRWYLRYALSYRDVEELMRERGVSVDHTTVFRWVQHYAPELDKRCRPLLRMTNASLCAVRQDKIQQKQFDGLYGNDRWSCEGTHVLGHPPLAW
jgi:hypothetical protein